MATQLVSLEEATASREKVGPQEGPRRGGFYSPEGECYFVYLEDALSFGQRVDEFFTVYKAVDDERLTGFQVKCTDFPRPHRLSYRVGRTNPEPGSPLDAVELVIEALNAAAAKRTRGMPDGRQLSEYIDAVRAVGKERLPVRREALCGAKG